MARNEDEMAKDLLACLHPRSGLDPDHAPRPRGEPGRLRWIVPAKGQEQRMTRITRIQARRVPWVHSPWMRPPGLDRSVSSVSSVVFRQKP
jgi:hypothetical protein